MLRSVATILVIAALCGLLNDIGEVQGQRNSDETWVRTVDGWEPYGALSAHPVDRFTLHPCLVGSFQLLFSVFALMAFPTSVRKSQ